MTPAPRVSVVVTTYDQARFLGEALASVARQTVPAAEVVVVDDGSSDDPGSVVAGRPGVRLVRRPNGGPAAARNTGLRETHEPYVLFLDADDLLTPFAIEAGLRCFEQHPEAGFVYGAHRVTDGSGRPTGPRLYAPAVGDPRAAMLRINVIAMHGAVLYRRDLLEEVGGFDEDLRRCEDYDLYLRLLQRRPMASHPVETALYRRHGGNATDDVREVLRAALRVHGRYRPGAADGGERRRAWREGRRTWREVYARIAAGAEGTRGGSQLRKGIAAARVAPVTTLGLAARTGAQRAAGRAPARAAQLLTGRPRGVGRVRLGDLDRVRPVSREFGYDRGTPVDRHYIEKFLERHGRDVAGRVLEVGDAAYSERFGGDRVAVQDVLHVHAGNPAATIVGDLGDPGVLPPGAFDCIVLTQTMHLVYDLRAAARQLAAALRPGGVLLVTVPGISPVDRDEWGAHWYWSLTPQALTRLLTERFAPELVSVEGFGNVYAATTFLQGLALEEVDRAKLDVADPAFPVVVAARAQRSRWAPVTGGTR
ncbi:glycosyltransferase family 2 protein [Geodermatophilus sp. SYSU D00758]